MAMGASAGGPRLEPMLSEHCDTQSKADAVVVDHQDRAAGAGRCDRQRALCEMTPV